MGSYSQWRVSAVKGTVKRFTYVCGTERFLVDEVISTTRKNLALEPHECVTIVLGGANGQTPERDMWELLGSVPATGKRLVVVHGVERIRRWYHLENLIDAGRELTGTWAVFESSEDNYPLTDDGVAAHIGALRDSTYGQLVRCSRPSEDDQLSWVMSRLPGAGKLLASYVLQRTGIDFSAAAAVCAKASLFGDRVNEALIDLLCEETPADGFADCLVFLRRDKALLCIPSMGDSEMLRAFALLDSRLETLSLLHKAFRNKMEVRDIHQKFNIHPIIVKKFRDAAGTYDRDRVRACRAALVMVEDAWRSGARTGVAESLVALW